MVSLPRTDMQPVNWSCLEYYAKLSLEFCTLHSIGCTWNRIYGPYLVAGNMSFWLQQDLVLSMFVTITLIVEVSAYAGQCSVFVVSVSLFVRCSSPLDLFLATVLVNLHFCSTEFDFQFLDVLEMVWHHRHTRKLWHSAFWYRVCLRWTAAGFDLSGHLTLLRFGFSSRTNWVRSLFPVNLRNYQTS